jgi:hypothetical protein
MEGLLPRSSRTMDGGGRAPHPVSLSTGCVFGIGYLVFSADPGDKSRQADTEASRFSRGVIRGTPHPGEKMRPLSSAYSPRIRRVSL